MIAPELAAGLLVLFENFYSQQHNRRLHSESSLQSLEQRSKNADFLYLRDFFTFDFFSRRRDHVHLSFELSNIQRCQPQVLVEVLQTDDPQIILLILKVSGELRMYNIWYVAGTQVGVSDIVFVTNLWILV